MKRRVARQTCGYTLIELVTVIVILGIIGAGASYRLADAIHVYMSAKDDAELAVETGSLMERITMELSHAGSLSPGAEPVMIPARGTSADSLLFTRPSAIATRCGGCMDHSTSVSYTFDATNKKLIRSTAQSGALTMADNIAAFSVSASADSISQTVYTITITRLAQSNADRRPLTLRTSVFPPSIRDTSWEEVVR